MTVNSKEENLKTFVWMSGFSPRIRIWIDWNGQNDLPTGKPGRYENWNIWKAGTTIKTGMFPLPISWWNTVR
jgi:hypothetical protein